MHIDFHRYADSNVTLCLELESKILHMEDDAKEIWLKSHLNAKTE